MESRPHVKLAVAPGEPIRILQLTDVHVFPAGTDCWNRDGRHIQFSDEGYSASAHVDLISDVLASSAPHLVILTGDIIDGRPFGEQNLSKDSWRPALLKLLEPILERGIPWTFVPGNHDDDLSPWCRQDLLAVYDLPGCVSRGATSFNHSFTVGPGFEAKGHESVRLWLFDYGPNSSDDKIMYEPPSLDAVDGYEQLSANLGTPCPGLVYLHIPLPEYAGLTPICGVSQLFDAAMLAGKVPKPWKYIPRFVRLLGKDRVAGNSKANTGLFDALVRRRNVFAVFCGHDHMCDAVFERQGIYLVYGRHGSSTPPSDWENKIRPWLLKAGARVVQYSPPAGCDKAAAGSFKTWIETRCGRERGSTFDFSQRLATGGCFSFLASCLRT